MESIFDYLRRRLKEVGPRRWEAIAEQAGVARRMPERIAYGERRNPTLLTVQRLLDYFDAIDRGARELPAPDIDPRYLPRSARPREGRLACAVKIRSTTREVPCTVEPDGDGVRVAFAEPQFGVAPGHEEQLDEYAVKAHEAGVWNVVTLSEYPKSKETPEGFERLQKQPGIVYVSPGTRMLSPFLYMMAAKSHTYEGADYPERIAELNRRMVAALHEAGAGILLGTDAAQAYHIPGFSIHEELAMLVDAGLSPYEAIEVGTRNAALAIGKSDEFGTVEIGKRADLILLESNPLLDVSNIQKRVSVTVRGL